MYTAIHPKTSRVIEHLVTFSSTCQVHQPQQLHTQKKFNYSNHSSKIEIIKLGKNKLRLGIDEVQ